jgi:hypothetical protein
MLGCRESQGLHRIMNRPVHLQQCCSAFHLEADIARRKRYISFVILPESRINGNAAAHLVQKAESKKKSNASFNNEGDQKRTLQRYATA